MPNTANCDDYYRLFVSDTPLMDVRAPVEFAKGAFPKATNLPLLDDNERAAVGTQYKDAGQDAAIELGHQLISGDIKQQRVAQWHEFARQHPGGYLYCFRGGLRSRLTQAALKDAGIDYPLILGGYKAMRRFLIDALDAQCKEGQHLIITGRTGTGKTVAINAVKPSVDLEGIANHKGSAFGQHLTPQPSQIDFENKLAIAFLKLRPDHNHPNNVIALEDESRLIGRCALPDALRQCMQSAPLVMIKEHMTDRLDLIIQEYIIDKLAEYQQHFGEQALDQFQSYVEERLMRIKKRLGGERHSTLSSLVSGAFRAHRQANDPEPHRAWIQHLLEAYYDPMYDFQLGKKNSLPLFQGNRREVIDWIKHYQEQQAQQISQA